MKHSDGFLKLVAQARKRIKEVTVEQVKARLMAGAEFRLIDVREDGEWVAGRIKGAEHLARGILERDVETAVPDKKAEIVLYCGGGFRSALAADNLRIMGFRNAASMKGGWRAWNQAKGPVVKGPSPR